MEKILLDDGELYYRQEGQGSGLLFLHAGIADSRMWAAQIAHFAPRYRVVAPDLRGYGRSLLPNGPFSYHGDLHQLIDRLGLAPVWLVGASFGGQVAIDFTLTYPALVDGLILLAPTVGGYEHDHAIQAFGAEEDALLEAGDLDGATELNMRMWVDGPRRGPDIVAADLRARVARMQHNAFSQPAPPHVSLDRLQPPAVERLADIVAPTLVICGELDQPSFLTCGRTIVDQIDGATLVTVPDAAHLVSMEAAPVVNRALDAFIGSHSI